MRNSTLNRATLSSENMSLLAELKAQNGEEEQILQGNGEAKEKNKSKQDELDFLWQNFKVSGQREEKSPGIYILTGFIAGALSMFLMTAMFSFTSSLNNEGIQDSGKKIVKKSHGSFIPVNQSENEAEQASEENEPVDNEEILDTPEISEKYLVKAGDSLEAISLKYYGVASPANTEKIQKANNLASPHAIFIGQELNIPMN